MKKIATFMFVALTSIALVSCGGEEKKDDKKKEDKKETKQDGEEPMSDEIGWNEMVKDQFMKTCVSEIEATAPQIDGEKYCSCMLDKVVVKYPNPADAVAMDKNWMQNEAMKCMGVE